MKSEGVAFNKAFIDLGYLKYIMVPAPDDVLIKLLILGDTYVRNQPL
jgi:hypothetical protein